ncbi:Ammonium transporter (Amt) Family, partial [Phytophthora palmivora]
MTTSRLYGFVGGLLTGLFATSDINPAIDGGAFYGHGIQFVHQLVSQCVAAGYSAIVTFLILMALKFTVGLRVSEEKEVNGMDVSYHGGQAYDYSADEPELTKQQAGEPRPFEHEDTDIASVDYKMNWTTRLALFASLSLLAATAAAQSGSGSVTCLVSQYLDTDTNECVNYENQGVKASTDFDTTIDSGNTAWMLAASALVMIMTPGVAFFYAG